MIEGVCFILFGTDAWESVESWVHAMRELNPLSPREKPYFSKVITVYQKTTSNIPAERYCLGYVELT